MKINCFEEILVWQKSSEFDKDVFKIIFSSKIKNDFALKDQLLRSTGSIMDNIAEGFERGGKKEFIHFLTISKGSCAEVKSQLYRALDRNYISQIEFDKLSINSEETLKMLGGFIKYLNQSQLDGVKFKTTKN